MSRGTDAQSDSKGRDIANRIDKQYKHIYEQKITTLFFFNWL